jgi:ribosome-binding protein aMBF1 (putative translation factor)
LHCFTDEVKVTSHEVNKQTKKNKKTAKTIKTTPHQQPVQGVSMSTTTDFGKVVRMARIQAGVKLSEMADTLQVSAAFLSGLETGRKKISDEWINKIASYVRNELKVPAPDLEVAAAVSNKSVNLDGLSPQHQMLVAGFARMKNFDEETEVRFRELLLAASRGEK